MAASLTELQHKLEDYIQQRLSVQTMLIMNATIAAKKAKLQVLENFASLGRGGVLDGGSQIDAQALREEIKTLEEYRDTTI